jgi:hypothetical protein
LQEENERLAAQIADLRRQIEELEQKADVFDGRVRVMQLATPDERICKSIGICSVLRQ